MASGFAWGIDVGNRALKAIRLVRDGEGLRIDDFEVIEHEHVLSQAGDNRESLIQQALANFAQRHSIKGGGVAIGVSGQTSFARFIKLPPVEPKKIPEIVRFEAIQQIPFPLEEVEWSYQLFKQPDSPEVEVGIFAMRKELVNHTIKGFTDVGLDVQVVQTNPLAVYNAMYHDERIKGTTMIIDLGAENTDLIIAEGESIWMRSIPIGGNHFTEALLKAFKLKFAKAEELKRNAATSKYGRQILQAMRPVFSDLVGEIQRSIGFYSSTHRDSRITKVLALGGTFRLPGLQKYLQQNLQLEVTRIDRLAASTPAEARFAGMFNENILSAVSAYGLALQAMGQGKITSSLLPERIRREKMWREKTKWFATAAALFVAAAGVGVASWYANDMAANSAVARDNHEKVVAATAKAERLNRAWSAIESSGLDERARIGNLLALVSDRDVTAALVQDVASAVPPDKLTPEQLKATPRNKRRVIEHWGWTMRYEADINRFLPPTMTEDQFNLEAEKASNAGPAYNPGYAPAGIRGATPYPMGRPMGRPMPNMPMPQMPVAPVATPGGAPTQRGFIISMQCRTPYADASGLVTETVVKYLRERNQDSKNPPENYSIVRVTIPSAVKLAMSNKVPPPHVKKAPLVFQVPGAAGGGAGRPQSPTGAPNPYRNGLFPPHGVNGQPGGYDPNFRPNLPTVGPNGVLMPNNPNDPTQVADPLADLNIPGESMKNDYLVTVLIAVVLDPPPKQVVANNP
ncbi:MAG TPA: type IV pilus assembly protein PilM [Tepidisphaeraceae bacterium]|jgi:type IV pilus assembly protein PilM|nr:type IV pilus assembly protein PilM [Tepidisphaeraceae bacterium]